jgi:hypothetical protein
MRSIRYNEKGKYFTPVVTKMPISASIQTDNCLVRGLIHIRQGERVKDELNLDETFLAVTDAVIYDQQGKIVRECEFISINRSHIVWLIPDDDFLEEAGSGESE